jgi:peptidoglycan/LPS O-acetylase OafA/YrhL
MTLTDRTSLVVEKDAAPPTASGASSHSRADSFPIRRQTVDKNFSYRADIDGLRGIAVCLVVLFHIFPDFFRNGFLGVDVFFVISGFVVTQSIERNLTEGFRRGLITFYAHRVKRILPALYVNLLVTICLCCLFIPPSDLRSIFKTSASAVAGLSNVALLIARFDYFSPDLSSNPFVHTWSLGAEEQFYLLFPSVLIAGFYLSRMSSRFTRTRLLLMLAALSVSFWTYAQFQAPVAAFYNVIARLWELLVGAILYLERTAILRHVNRRLHAALPVIGAALIMLALVPLDNVVNHFGNIFVVVGAGMLIVSGALPGWMTSLLAAGSLVWIGRLSYSLYLWHYPILTLARWNLDIAQPLIVAVMLTLIVGLSVLSYRFIEIPLRYSKVSSGTAIASAFTAGAALLLFIWFLYLLPPSRIYLGHAEAYAGLWPPADIPLAQSLKASQRDCHLEYRDTLSPDAFSRCSTERANQRFVYLIGNSHAQHLVPMLDSVARVQGYGYSALTISNCRLMSATQIVTAINYPYDLCKDYFDGSVDLIARTARQGDVVLVGARSLIDEPSTTEMNIASNVIVNGSRLSRKQAYLKSRADFDALLKASSSRGVSVVFVGPTPQFTMPATMCVPEWFRPLRDCAVPVQSVLAERDAYLKSIAGLLASNPNAHFWDPLPAFCSETRCLPYANNKLLFRDRHHLSAFGSQSLVNMFLQFLGRIGISPLRHV